jgi:hypothetical protein
MGKEEYLEHAKGNKGSQGKLFCTTEPDEME